MSCHFNRFGKYIPKQRSQFPLSTLRRLRSPKTLLVSYGLVVFYYSKSFQLDLLYGVSCLSAKSLARLPTETTSVQEVCARKILQSKHRRTF